MVRWLARAGTCLGAEFFGHFALLTCRRERGIVSQPPTPTVRPSAGDAYQRAESPIVAGGFPGGSPFPPGGAGGGRPALGGGFGGSPPLRMGPAKTGFTWCCF